MKNLKIYESWITDDNEKKLTKDLKNTIVSFIRTIYPQIKVQKIAAKKYNI